MDSEERRQQVLSAIEHSVVPVTGAGLAKQFQVSRQVIVQDVAILRAAGHKILATPQGYIIPHIQRSYRVKRIMALQHATDQIESELMAIVDLGGKVLDVVIEHPLYGEFKGQLMIASPSDVREYLARMAGEGAEPLSSLTEGIHLHTVEADDEETLNRIENVLREKGYLLGQD